jgi:hypothetical protein
MCNMDSDCNNTGNVRITLIRFHANIVAAEKQFWVCVCSFRYESCNAHAPYFHLWPVRLYNIFPHCLIKGAIFEKKLLLVIKFLFWFSLQFPSEIFLILRRIKRDIQTVYWPSCMVPIILIKFQLDFNFLDWLSKNTSNFMKICPMETEFNADGRTDRYDEANSRFSHVCKRA